MPITGATVWGAQDSEFRTSPSASNDGPLYGARIDLVQHLPGTLEQAELRMQSLGQPRSPRSPAYEAGNATAMVLESQHSPASPGDSQMNYPMQTQYYEQGSSTMPSAAASPVKMQLFNPLPVLQSQYYQLGKESASRRARNGRFPMVGGYSASRNWIRTGLGEPAGPEGASLPLQNHLDHQMALAYHSAHLGQYPSARGHLDAEGPAAASMTFNGATEDRIRAVGRRGPALDRVIDDSNPQTLRQCDSRDPSLLSNCGPGEYDADFRKLMRSSCATSPIQADVWLRRLPQWDTSLLKTQGAPGAPPLLPAQQRRLPMPKVSIHTISLESNSNVGTGGSQKPGDTQRSIDTARSKRSSSIEQERKVGFGHSTTFNKNGQIRSKIASIKRVEKRAELKKVGNARLKRPALGGLGHEDGRAALSGSKKDSARWVPRVSNKKLALQPLFLRNQVGPQIDEAIIIQSSSRKAKGVRDYILVQSRQGERVQDLAAPASVLSGDEQPPTRPEDKAGGMAAVIEIPSSKLENGKDAEMAEYSLQTLIDQKNENNQIGHYLQSAKRMKRSVRKGVSSHEACGPTGQDQQKNDAQGGAAPQRNVLAPQAATELDTGKTPGGNGSSWGATMNIEMTHRRVVSTSQSPPRSSREDAHQPGFGGAGLAYLPPTGSKNTTHRVSKQELKGEGIANVQDDAVDKTRAVPRSHGGDAAAGHATSGASPRKPLALSPMQPEPEQQKYYQHMFEQAQKGGAGEHKPLQSNDDTENDTERKSSHLQQMTSVSIGKVQYPHTNILNEFDVTSQMSHTASGQIALVGDQGLLGQSKLHQGTINSDLNTLMGRTRRAENSNQKPLHVENAERFAMDPSQGLDRARPAYVVPEIISHIRIRERKRGGDRAVGALEQQPNRYRSTLDGNAKTGFGKSTAMPKSPTVNGRASPRQQMRRTMPAWKTGRVIANAYRMNTQRQKRRQLSNNRPENIFATDLKIDVLRPELSHYQLIQMIYPGHREFVPATRRAVPQSNEGSQAASCRDGRAIHGQNQKASFSSTKFQRNNEELLGLQAKLFRLLQLQNLQIGYKELDMPGSPTANPHKIPIVSTISPAMNSENSYESLRRATILGGSADGGSLRRPREYLRGNNLISNFNQQIGQQSKEAGETRLPGTQKTPQTRTRNTASATRSVHTANTGAGGERQEDADKEQTRQQKEAAGLNHHYIFNSLYSDMIERDKEKEVGGVESPGTRYDPMGQEIQKLKREISREMKKFLIAKDKLKPQTSLHVDVRGRSADGSGGQKILRNQVITVDMLKPVELICVVTQAEEPGHESGGKSSRDQNRQGSFQYCHEHKSFNPQRNKAPPVIKKKEPAKQSSPPERCKERRTHSSDRELSRDSFRRLPKQKASHKVQTQERGPNELYTNQSSDAGSPGRKDERHKSDFGLLITPKGVRPDVAHQDVLITTRETMKIEGDADDRQHPMSQPGKIKDVSISKKSSYIAKPRERTPSEAHVPISDPRKLKHIKRVFDIDLEKVRRATNRKLHVGVLKSRRSYQSAVSNEREGADASAQVKQPDSNTQLSKGEGSRLGYLDPAKPHLLVGSRSSSQKQLATNPSKDLTQEDRSPEVGGDALRLDNPGRVVSDGWRAQSKAAVSGVMTQSRKSEQDQEPGSPPPKQEAILESSQIILQKSNSPDRRSVYSLQHQSQSHSQSQEMMIHQDFKGNSLHALDKTSRSMHSNKQEDRRSAKNDVLPVPGERAHEPAPLAQPVAHATAEEHAKEEKNDLKKAAAINSGPGQDTMVAVVASKELVSGAETVALPKQLPQASATAGNAARAGLEAEIRLSLPGKGEMNKLVRVNEEELVLNCQSADEIHSKEHDMFEILDNTQNETQYLKQSNVDTMMALSRPAFGTSRTQLLIVANHDPQKAKTAVGSPYLKAAKSQIREREAEQSSLSGTSPRVSVLRKSQRLAKPSALITESFGAADHSREENSLERSQNTLQQISARISTWEKQLVYDSKHYEQINEHYQQVQKQQFHQAIQRGLHNSKKFIYKPAAEQRSARLNRSIFGTSDESSLLAIHNLTVSVTSLKATEQTPSSPIRRPTLMSDAKAGRRDEAATLLSKLKGKPRIPSVDRSQESLDRQRSAYVHSLSKASQKPATNPMGRTIPANLRLHAPLLADLNQKIQRSGISHNLSSQRNRVAFPHALDTFRDLQQSSTHRSHKRRATDLHVKMISQEAKRFKPMANDQDTFQTLPKSQYHHSRPKVAQALKTKSGTTETSQLMMPSPNLPGPFSPQSRRTAQILPKTARMAPRIGAATGVEETSTWREAAVGGSKERRASAIQLKLPKVLRANANIGAIRIQPK